MNALIFVSLLLYAITNIVCVASASCPCHIPCTGKPEVCTCFGPCGDDGYGCKGNGDDYEFLSQIECGEGKWQVECIRTASISSKNILDDTNPFAAYEQAAQDNLLEAFQDEEDADDATDDDQNIINSQSMQWFGGNWFDFFGKNSDQFFAENIDNEDTKYMKENNDDQISIDNKDDFDFDSSMMPQSSQRTLKTSSQSSKKQNEAPIYDDLGHNEAGYKIIAIPLYILILCIVAAAIGGMLMCAGFVYCGLHCCCPLPPSSPTMTSQQRSHAVEMARVMRSLTLGGGSKSYDSEPGVYHRMGNYLHNPTNDEASSVASLSPLNRSKKDRVRDKNRNRNGNDNDDEYANDSEDDKKENYVTRGNIDDMVDDYDYNESKGGDNDNNDYLIKNDYDQQPLHALVGGGGESDIDNDSQSDDMMNEWSNLIEARMKIANDSYKDIDIEEPEHEQVIEEEEEEEEEQEKEKEEVNNNEIENETEYDDDDELRPLKSSTRDINHNDIQSEDMLGMVTVDRDSDDDDDDEDDIDPDPECTETENEGLPLLNNDHNVKAK